MINYDIEAELKPHLANDENLLWTGVPKQGVLFRKNDFFLIPLTMIWLGLIIMGAVVISKQGVQASFGLPSYVFFIPGILIGSYLTIGRFFIDSWRRSKIKYGVTNERIIIISGLFSKEVSSLKSTTDTISYKEKKDGSGTVIFGQTNFQANITDGMLWPGIQQPHKLELIDDARKVYEMIQQQNR